MRALLGLMVIGLTGHALAQGADDRPCPVLLEGTSVPGGLAGIREALRGAGFVDGAPGPWWVVKLQGRSRDTDGSDFYLYELCVSAGASSAGASGGLISLLDPVCASPKQSDADERIARIQAAAAWLRANRVEFPRKLAQALARLGCPRSGIAGTIRDPSPPVVARADAGSGEPTTHPPKTEEHRGSPWWVLVASTLGVAAVGFAAHRIARTRSRPPAVFVCYAHEDNVDADPARRWVARLREHLEPLVRGGLLRVWWDREIPLGARWDETIHAAVEQAFAAVVLVSPDALDSSYIMDRELPALIESLHRGRLTLLPVAVRPCDPARVLSYRSDATSKQFSLAELQWPHELDAALSEMDPVSADEILRRIAARLAELAAAHRTRAS
jgi:hypothetical protein